MEEAEEESGEELLFCNGCDKDIPITEFSNKQVEKAAKKRICKISMNKKRLRQCFGCKEYLNEQAFGKDVWAEEVEKQLCLKCTPRPCATCGKRKRKYDFHVNEWRQDDEHRKCRKCNDQERVHGM